MVNFLGTLFLFFFLFSCEAEWDKEKSISDQRSRSGTENLFGADQEDVLSTLSGTVDLTTSGSLSVIGHSYLEGACSPDSNHVSLSITGAVPDRVSPCLCIGGNFSCTVRFTSLPENPVVEVTGIEGGVDSETFSTVHYLELSNTLIVDSTTDLIVMGGCAPSGVGNISLVGTNPSFSSTCDCSNGSVSCTPETLATISKSFEVTGTLAGATDTFNPEIQPVVDLDIVEVITTIGENVNLEGTCFPESVDVINIYWSGNGQVQPDSPLVCDCTSFQIANCRDTSSKTVASISLFETHKIHARIEVGGKSFISTKEVTLESPVSNLEISSKGVDFIEIGWSDALFNGAPFIDYTAEYRIAPSGPWVTFNDGVSTDERIIVTGLSPDMEYDLRVVPINSGGVPALPSNIVTGETLVNDPFFFGNKAFNLGGATQSSVVSLEDNNDFLLNGSVLVTLQRGETHVFTSAQNDIIEGSKGFYVAGRLGVGSCRGAVNIVWMIRDWAGKNFLFDHTRYTPKSVTIRAFEDSNIIINRDGSVFTTQFISAGTNHTFNIPAYDLYEIVSDGTIAVYGSSSAVTNPGDAYPILPLRRDLLGVPSSRAYFQVADPGTNYSRWYSDDNGPTTGFFIHTALNSLGGTGSQYSGRALRVIADSPLSGHSTADADGCTGAPFVPRTFQRRNYAVNVLSEWVKFVSDRPAVVTRTNPNGSTATFTLSKTGTAPEALYHARLTNVLGGTIFEADERMAVWYEPNTTAGAAIEDETILFGWD